MPEGEAPGPRLREPKRVRTRTAIQSPALPSSDIRVRVLAVATVGALMASTLDPVTTTAPGDHVELIDSVLAELESGFTI